MLRLFSQGAWTLGHMHQPACAALFSRSMQPCAPAADLPASAPVQHLIRRTAQCSSASSARDDQCCMGAAYHGCMPMDAHDVSCSSHAATPATTSYLTSTQPAALPWGARMGPMRLLHDQIAWAQGMGASRSLHTSSAGAAGAAAAPAAAVAAPTSRAASTGTVSTTAAPQPSTPSGAPYPRVHVKDLQTFLDHPNPRSATAFAALLLQQLPARTESHLSELAASVGLTTAELIGSGAPAVHHSGPVCYLGHSLDQMLRSTVAAAAARKHAALLQFLKDCGQQLGPPQSDSYASQSDPVRRSQTQSDADVLGSPDSAALRAADAAHELRSEVEVEVTRLGCELQRLTEAEAWWDDSSRVARLDAVMESHVAYTLALRVLLSEYLAVWSRARKAGGHHSMGLRHDAGRQRCKWSTAGPSGPPGHDSEAATSRSLIVPQAPLLQLLRNEAEDTRAFCVEKNSTAPEVEVVGDEGFRVPLLAEAYVEYIYAEVMKNAMQALIAKWGAWDVDEAVPIRVQLAVHAGPVPPASSSSGSSGGNGSSGGSSGAAGSTAGHLSITISDTGGGMSAAQIAKAANYFMTSHKPKNPEDVHYGYGYSRDHGAQFQGLGVGMPLSRAYARFMGGHVTWHGDKTKGTTRVRLVLPLDGFEF